MYIFFALAGFGMLAFNSLFDKKLLSNQARSVLAYTFFMSAFSVLLIGLLPWGQRLPGTQLDWWLVAVDAVLFFLGLIGMFTGIQQSEVSHAGPLIGASVPFFTVILSHYWLQEILSTSQLAAIGFLILGSLIISFEVSDRHRGWHRGMLFSVIGGFCFAGSHVVSKYLYGQVGFISAIVLVRFVLGLLGLGLLIIPKVRREIFGQSIAAPAAGRTNFLPIFGNMALGVVAVGLVQYAISLGSVSVVNALEGWRYGLLVILVAILSRWDTKFFTEKYAPWEWLQEGVAVGLIIVGLVLLI
ncbi:MAG: DMT family transporter [bacterium]|nr:DMT family transporter [bacterium]